MNYFDRPPKPTQQTADGDPGTVYINPDKPKDIKNGLSLESLPTQSLVMIITANSVYKITIIDPSTGEAKIEGGRFPEPQQIRILGSFKDKEELISGYIVKGMSLRIKQISSDSSRKILITNTSPIERILKEI